MKELPQGSLLSESFIKKGIHFAGKAIPVSLTTSLIITACGGEKASSSSQLPATSKTDESGALPNPENPFAVLGMPFPKNKDMTIQQGWLYDGIATQDGRKEHNGIDFIKGELDNSRTWKSFPVTAVADGKACANPRSRIGNAVLLTHNIGDTPIGSSYYGHLENAEKDIPECNTGQTVSKRKGDKIGNAGADGTQDKSWIHLHFQVNDANGNSIDPYDLRDERELYPDPNFKNGKPCGPKALFIDCYPKGAVVALPKDSIPPISGKASEKKAETSVKGVETKKEEWKTFKSPNFPYEIKLPASWENILDNDISQSFMSTSDAPPHGLLQIYYEAVDPDLTLESFLRKQEQNVSKSKDATILKTTKRKVAGFNAQTILSTQTIRTSPQTIDAFEDYATSFIVVEADGSRKMWTIRYDYNVAQVSGPNAERVNNQLLESFSLTQPSKNIPIEKNEKKVSISKKPEELYRALLTSPISPNTLPQGMSSRGISAAEIDATGKALKQVGAVNILIEDSVSTPARGTTNGGISYAIFPDSSGAKNASELIGTHLGNGQVLKDFPYPTKIYTTENNMMGLVYTTSTVLVTSVENVTVITSLTGNAKSPNANLVQSRTIELAKTAIEHLGKVGK